MDYSSALVQARNRLGLSQSTLARETGLSLLSVQNLEKGRGNPCISTLRALFGRLGIETELKFRSPDWAALSDCGLPLAVEKKAPRIRGIPPHERRAVLLRELPFAALQAPNDPRIAEAVVSLLIALKDHFPTFYGKTFARREWCSRLLREIPLNGHIIKLRRIALARLAEYL